MFYLGGMTFGYLTPCVEGADAKVASVAPQASGLTKQARRDTDRRGTEDVAEDRPILWPWHLFH